MQSDTDRGATEGSSGYASGGWFYTWWRGDPLPGVGALVGFAPTAVETLGEVSQLARLSGTSSLAIEERRQTGNRAYMASIAGEPAGYGWSAARSADIGELGIRLILSPGERYLWDFVTLPAWRGHGVYPHLLQAIIAQELREGVERFWIGHEEENKASARGILRAGFQPVGELMILGNGRFAMAPSGPLDRARRGADLLGVPLAGPGDDTRPT